MGIFDFFKRNNGTLDAKNIIPAMETSDDAEENEILARTMGKGRCKLNGSTPEEREKAAIEDYESQEMHVPDQPHYEEIKIKMLVNGIEVDIGDTLNFFDFPDAAPTRRMKGTGKEMISAGYKDEWLSRFRCEDDKDKGTDLDSQFKRVWDRDGHVMVTVSYAVLKMRLAEIPSKDDIAGLVKTGKIKAKDYIETFNVAAEDLKKYSKGRYAVRKGERAINFIIDSIIQWKTDERLWPWDITQELEGMLDDYKQNVCQELAMRHLIETGKANDSEFIADIVKTINESTFPYLDGSGITRYPLSITEEEVKFYIKDIK